MTKIILHGVATQTDEATLKLQYNGHLDMFSLAAFDGECFTDFCTSKEALLEFAYTIIDEFEEDDVEEAPKSYVEVVD